MGEVRLYNDDHSWPSAAPCIDGLRHGTCPDISSLGSDYQKQSGGCFLCVCPSKVQKEKVDAKVMESSDSLVTPCEHPLS